MRVLDIVPSDETLAADARFSMYHPSEVELSETLKTVFDEAERLRPSRVVFDSLSELRLLAESPLRYRRQILALKRFFGRLGATVLLVDDRTNEESNAHLHSIAHGVINLARGTPDYGVLRRRLQVIKMRARTFREGLHDFVIRRGGLQVFPRLVAAEHVRDFPAESRVQRHRRARRAAGRRARARHQRADHRRRRHRQVVDRRRVRHRGGASRRARDAVPVRREPADLPASHGRPRHGPRGR